MQKKKSTSVRPQICMTTLLKKISTSASAMTIKESSTRKGIDQRFLTPRTLCVSCCYDVIVLVDYLGDYKTWVIDSERTYTNIKFWIWLKFWKKKSLGNKHCKVFQLLLNTPTYNIYHLEAEVKTLENITSLLGMTVTTRRTACWTGWARAVAMAAAEDEDAAGLVPAPEVEAGTWVLAEAVVVPSDELDCSWDEELVAFFTTGLMMCRQASFPQRTWTLHYTCNH